MKTFMYPKFQTFGLFCLLTLFSVNVYGQNYSLYAIIGDRLATIDPITGSASEVATLTPGYSTFAGLTYEPNLDLLLAIADRRTDPRLISIDRCSGEITEIGFVDQPSPFLDIKLIEAMEYNPEDGLLYASGYELNPDQNWFSSRRLMTIDPLTGNATVVATISGTCQADVDAMAFTTNAKYVVDGCPNPKRLYTIDLNTGSTTLIGSYNAASGAILAVHNNSGALFTTTNGGGRELYSLSTTTGAETLIGQTHTSSDFGGGVIVQMAFAPSLDQDGDGYTVCENDCNDNDPNIYPGAVDICDNIDNNCDGQIDEDIDPDPVSSIENLIALIETLVQNGDLDQGQAEELIDKLDLAIDKLNDEKPKVAINQLNAFHNKLDEWLEDGTIELETVEVLQGIGNCLENSLDDGMNLVVPSINNNAAEFTAKTIRDLSVFPNPSKGSINIDLLNFLEQDVSITIFNTLGQPVLAIPAQKVQNPILSIDLNQHQLPNGVYWLALRSQKESQTQMKQLVLTR